MIYDRIQSELLNECREQKRQCDAIPTEEVQALVDLIIKNYCDGVKPSGQLWEGIHATEELNLANDGDQLMSYRLNKLNGELLVLVDDWKGYSGLRVASGCDWNSVISNMYNFKWYIYHQLNKTLIARNDHDFLLISESRSEE
jgi:hypothetical protein